MSERTNQPENPAENHKPGLHRELKTRHITMIAIGGTIGAGLFISSGAAISESGPGGTLLAYAVMSLVAFCIMTAVAEMAGFLSLEGAYKSYPSRFVDPALGFVNGWNWWFGGAITIAAELVGCGIIMKYWFPESSTTMWAAVFLVIMITLNLFTVKHFGESSFWLSSIKIIVVLVFVGLGLAMILGLTEGHEVGFQNWVFDGGEKGRAPFVNGGTGVLLAFLVAGFSFSNVELIGVSAAESRNPRRDIPRAMYSVFFIVTILYLGTLFIVGTLLPFTNEYLVNSHLDTISQSPFAIIFASAGFKMAATMMNIVILSALLTCGNSTIYSVSRLLSNMGETGDAPRFVARINNKGVPARAVIITSLFGGIAFFTSFIGDGAIYILCYSIVGISAFINWLCFLLAHYRFRKAYLLQKRNLSELPYRAPFYPCSDLLGVLACLMAIFGANYWIFMEELTWYNLFSGYGLIPIALLLFFGYKLRYKTRIIPLKDCSFEPEHPLG